MGRAHVHADAGLLARLLGDPRLRDLVSVTNASLYDAGRLYLAEVSSPLLRAGYNGMQSIVLDEAHGVRFKKDVDV